MSNEFEVDQSTSREEAAALLRELADGIAAGSVHLDADHDAIAVEIPENFDIEFEFEREEGMSELEVEMEWPDSEAEVDVSPDTPDSDRSDVTDDRLVKPGEPPESLARFELFEGSDGEWRWRLRHRNGNIIAASGEGYTRKHNAMKGLRSVKRNASDAEITEV